MKGFAAVFNLVVIWFVYSIKGNDWANVYYNFSSGCVIISIVTRMGYDLFLAYSEQKKYVAEINLFNIFGLFFAGLIGAFLLSEILIDSQAILVFICVLFISLTSLCEGVIRVKILSDVSQLIVLIYSNFILLIAILFFDQISQWELLVISSVFSLVVLFTYLILNGIRIKLICKSSFDVNAACLAHGVHGALNQHYLVFFLTRYLQEWSLPILITTIRICNLASWPLSYFTFSDIASKNNNLGGFIDKYVKQLKLIVVFVLISLAAYMLIISDANYIIPSLILSIGIIVFSIFGFGFFYKISSSRFFYILSFQLLMVVVTYLIAEAGLLSLLTLVSTYSLYLITCSFSYRLLPE
jgi:hypothetical protein